MANQTKVYLDEWIDHYRPYTTNGQCADYIPVLGKLDPFQLGICIIGADGTIEKSGDWDVPFTLQSISKVFSFIAVCLSRGLPEILEKVDVEPTGDPFNSMIRLEINKPGKPFNPLINAGAITVASMLPGKTPEDKLNVLYELFEKIWNKRPPINEEVFCSEWKTAHRNRAIAHYLKEMGYLETEVEEALEVYLKQCSIEIHTEDIAYMGLILSQDGYDPVRRMRVFPKEIARLTKALMTTCGMYNESGKFAAFTGIPAKSGVSGGIMGTVPPRVRKEDTPFKDGCGIGIYGPAIDKFGNSVAGGMLLRHISHEWDLSIF
ncbi:glutaminase [Fictibacillus sp. Mic-4]|uniref:glutaminase n=1 Tax=Fictibacillus TaxID=1329200 RepID=UPI0004242AFE|nr:glutaminase [Fictibacillus gelatini]